jgi:hypothetical protein
MRSAPVRASGHRHDVCHLPFVPGLSACLFGTAWICASGAARFHAVQGTGCRSRLSSCLLTCACVPQVDGGVRQRQQVRGDEAAADAAGRGARHTAAPCFPCVDANDDGQGWQVWRPSIFGGGARYASAGLLHGCAPVWRMHGQWHVPDVLYKTRCTHTGVAFFLLAFALLHLKVEGALQRRPSRSLGQDDAGGAAVHMLASLMQHPRVQYKAFATSLTTVHSLM